MLSKITWAEFLMTMILAAFAYYLVVILIYYRGALIQFILGRYNKPASPAIETSLPAAKNTLQVTQADIDNLRKIVQDLDEAIAHHDAPLRDKDAIFSLLQDKLTGYRGLTIPAFRTALNNGLIQSAAQHCGLTLTEAELNTLWKQLHQQ